MKAWKTRLATVDWVPWLIIGLGAFLRLFLLGIKPPHFDEGINGWFVDQMVKNGFYKYDPTNYHGPLHFYIEFLSQTLFGRNLWALRLPVVLASIFSIHLTLKFEPFAGRNVSRLAALAMAVSPGFIFYGRYSIHEVWLLVFGMLFIFGLLGMWKFGTRKYLWCAGMGLAGMVLTKETYIIHLGCAGVAVLVTWIGDLTICAVRRFFGKKEVVPDASWVPQRWSHLDLMAVIGVGIAAILLFYSGTFLNWGGVKGLYQTFSAWFETGSDGHGHEKPWYYWLKLIAHYEVPILIGLVLCLVWHLFKEVSLRYLAVYGVGLLMAYSIVNYKTPWCIINIVWPFLFAFGGILVVTPVNYRTVAHVIAGLAIFASLGSAIWLNFFRCTTDTEPYVYVQTYNDIDRLTGPLLELAKQDPKNYQLTGNLIRTSAYPLPWILGDFHRAGYYENEKLPAKIDADFVVVQEDRIAEVEAKLNGVYYTSWMNIRPYQDGSKIYFSADVFKGFFSGRIPDFAGKASGNGPSEAP